MMLARTASVMAWLLLASSVVWSQDKGSPVYKPSEEILERMTPAEAKSVIEKTFPVWLDRNPFNSWADRLDGVSVREDHVEFRTGDRKNPIIRLYIRDLSRIEMVRDSMLGRSMFGVLLDEINVLWFINGLFSDDERRTGSMRLTDAFYVLKNYPLITQRQEESFRRAVEWFRAQNPRPQLPEEARRFRVQAEFSVEQKRFGDAAQAYLEALKTAPWWPEGYYNRSLVLAELKRYAEAIGEMKRFLVLEPNHARARAAQDEIYRWESLVPR